MSRKFIDSEHISKFQRKLVEVIFLSLEKSLSELLLIRIARNIRTTPTGQFHELMQVYEECTQEAEE